MLKDITLGQYFPGTSIIHRLDPRTKLILTFVYMACVFIVKSYVSNLAALLFLSVCIYLSRIKPSAVFRGLKPIMFIMIFTAVVNMFYTQGRVIWQLGFLKLTAEGIRQAFFMILRVAMLVIGTFLLTYTTSPIALTDGLESMMGGLKRFNVPVHAFTMMMSIALRFIPTLLEETDKIMSAQKARGASFDTGKINERAKALMPLLIPLFLSAFRRADELAVAMESRCYNGGEGRTRMKQLTMGRNDALAFIVGAALLVIIICLAVNGL